MIVYDLITIFPEAVVAFHIIPDRLALASLAYVPAFELTVSAVVDVLPCLLQVLDRVAQQIVCFCFDLLLYPDAAARSFRDFAVICPFVVSLDRGIAVPVGHGERKRPLLFRRRVLEEPELPAREIFDFLVVFPDHFAFFPNSM